MKNMIFILLLLLGQEGISQPIKPSDSFPQYWSYHGNPILLLGGSVEDNLFQVEDISEQLDLLQLVGGNYVRNTMSSRDSGDHWPFLQLETGKYDLNQWNESYWNKFESFLKETHKRKIIVQLEVWATFDFYRENWLVNPFNPAKNINYSPERSKLPIEVPTHPIYTDNPFFRSVPSLGSNAKTLEYQQKFVDKLLSYSLDFDHVLYCMDNETSVSAEWGKFWANYIRQVAKENDKIVQTTEMWDPWDLGHVFHRATFDHPETYTFVDISQNNHQTGEAHWQNGLAQIERLKKIDALRPLNNVKIYGNDGGRHKTTRDAIESFCRNVLFGAASARFHRPTSGQGLNETAQKVIKTLRAVTDKMDFFQGKPNNQWLSDREENEAYCRGIINKEYAVYFPNGGDVFLEAKGNYEIEWMEILTDSRKTKKGREQNGKVKLETPSGGHWIAYLKRVE